MSRLTGEGTAEPVLRDQILRRERGQGNIHFSCSADHVQNWQPYPVDPYSCCMCLDGSVEFCEATPIGQVDEPKVSLSGRETDQDLRSACRCVA